MTERCAALAHKVLVEPALGDALELTEQVQPRLAVVVAPLSLQQIAGEVVHDSRAARVADGGEVEVGAFAEDPLVARASRTDHLRRQP